MNFVPAVSGFFSRFSGRPSGASTLALGYFLDHGETNRWCSKSGAMMYEIVPFGSDVENSSILDCTEGVKVTGLKMTRLPVLSFMRVPRPPILTMPKRLKGVEKVAILFGRTSRITVDDSDILNGNFSV